MSFDVNVEAKGDIVLKCSHLSRTTTTDADGNTTEKPSSTPIFRTAFNIGYVTHGILRLARDELDGVTPDDARFQEDFFVDVIFQPAADGELSQEGDGEEDRQFWEVWAPITWTILQ